MNEHQQRLWKNMIDLIEGYLNNQTQDFYGLIGKLEGDFNWLICPKCNDAWESDSLKAMVICPKCDCAFHNPYIDNA